jgi:NAD(P)-dependent dehydrogenase (short-subunit alcohol dehydrogenase family)
VVFGGSYGIGGDIAELAQTYGATVVSYSRSSTDTHVERRDEVAAAARDALVATGRIDFVVNAAVVLPRGLLKDASEETVYNSTEINYLAPIFIAQEFFPHLAATGGSLLMFISSSYTRGHSGNSLYSSAKAATVNLTQALADEWGGSGVRVNCINPERTGTPMRTKAFGEEAADSLLKSIEVVDVRRLDPFAPGELG